MSRAVSQPPSSALELDGWSWRRAGAADIDHWQRLAGIGDNRLMFRLPADGTDFAALVETRSIGRQMVCLHDGIVVGASGITQRNRQSLNAHLTVIFASPSEAALPAAMFVRHLFWSMPLHRLYVQLPLVESTPEYLALLTNVGFQIEGRVKDFAMLGRRLVDVIVVGLLRRDFEAWCLKTEPRLAL